MSDTSDNARPAGLMRQQLLLDRVVAEIVERAPEGWVRIEAVLVLLGKLLKMKFEIFTADGPFDGVPDISFPDAASELRDVMYVERRGTWFTLSLTVWSSGEVSSAFDYDNRPPSRTPLGYQVRHDLQMYPRDVVPQWMLDELALIDGDETGNRERAVRPHLEIADVEEDVLEAGEPMMEREQAQEMACGFVPEESGMYYVKVTRAEGGPADPVVIFSELDADGYECRKVEVFRNGLVDCAGAGFEGATTWLADDPLPSMDELALVPGIVGVEMISPQEFQVEWLVASGPE
ncbi:hypothetical protein ABZ540_23685 [Nocardia xishanensis]|uniref:DUF6881 domain-containing protein n=1 Tax=Nocardia xishanensis TaxID=238964 RepID=UPI003410F420